MALFLKPCAAPAAALILSFLTLPVTLSGSMASSISAKPEAILVALCIPSSVRPLTSVWTTFSLFLNGSRIFVLALSLLSI